MRTKPARWRPSLLKAEWDKALPGIRWTPKSFCFGVYENGSLVGYTLFRINGGVGHLKEIIVRRKLRKKGVGRLLASHFIGFCRKKGCHKLTLRTSEAHKEALPFYRKLGFRREAVHKRDVCGLEWYTYSKFLS